MVLLVIGQRTQTDYVVIILLRMRLRLPTGLSFPLVILQVFTIYLMLVLQTKRMHSQEIFGQVPIQFQMIQICIFMTPSLVAKFSSTPVLVMEFQMDGKFILASTLTIKVIISSIWIQMDGMQTGMVSSQMMFLGILSNWHQENHSLQQRNTMYFWMTLMVIKQGRQ